MDRGDCIKYEQGRKQPEDPISLLGQNNNPESCLYYASKENAQTNYEENPPDLNDELLDDDDNNAAYSYYPHDVEPQQTTPYEQFMSQLCESIHNTAAISYNNNSAAISYSHSASRRSTPAYHCTSLADSGIVSESPDSRGSPLSYGAVTGSRSSPSGSYGCPPGFENTDDHFREVFDKDFEEPNR